VAQNLVAVKSGEYAVLELNAASAAVLRGERKVELRRERTPPRSSRARKSAGDLAQAEAVVDVSGSPLWEALRALRQVLAKQAAVPPYVVMHDAVLRQIVGVLPASMQALRQVKGLGVHKIERYGNQLLALVAQHTGRTAPEVRSSFDGDFGPINSTTLATLELLKRGVSPEQIALERNLSPNTVHDHCSRAIASGSVALRAVVTISESEISTIEEQMRKVPDGETLKLKPIFEAFGGRYSYGILKCVYAGMYNASSGSAG